MTYPLSAAQRRAWFLEQLEPGGARHHVSAEYIAVGALDIDALRRAFASATAHHEILRTSFAAVDGELVQSVAGTVDPDVRSCTEPDAAAWLRALVVEPFELGTAPLWRVGVAPGADRTATVVVVAHGALLDEGSIRRLVASLDGAGDHPGDQPGPTGRGAEQFGPHAAAEQATLESPDAIAELEAWRHELAGIPAVLQLPGDRPRAARQSYAAAQVTRRAERFPPAAREIHVAALVALLARYSGQDDIVIGFDADSERTLIGPTTDPRPLRIDLSDNPTWSQLLERTSAVMARAASRPRVPYAVLAEELATDRDTSRNPLFQVALLDVGRRRAPVRVAGATLSVAEQAVSTSPYDIAVECEQDDGATLLRARFATDLFDAPSVDDLLVRYERLVVAALEAPDTPVGALPLLDAIECAGVLARAHGPATDRPPETLAGAFREQVARRPDAPAVTGGGRTLSYGALDERANRLAHALRAEGVGHGDLVAVLLPRDPDLLTAIVAIHRCGAAYVPLEATYPTDRLEFMIGDSGARVLVTNRASSAVVDGTARRVLLDDDLLATQPADPLEVVVEPHDLAYVIYTSGSTGRPKGVLVEHAGVVNLMHEMAVRPGLRAGEVMVGVTTPAFDLSVPDLFLPLLTGAHLVLADPITAGDPTALARLLDAAGADLMQATPATWRMLLDAGWAGRPGLRVVCGGEGYTAALARPLAAKVAEVWNFYGPTEATVWCTSARLDDPTDPLPLGRALPGYLVFVSDAVGMPVPAGVAGELLIGGIGLARGYHERPELTAERFIESGPAAQRLYRTGDLVRARRDGSLEFIGRIDHQVKLRGFRIELGEIEAVFAAHPGVRDVVVIVHGSGNDARLVAYVVGEVEGAALREHVAGRLPAYMVPSTVMVLDALPRGPNGKTDRKALPVPDAPAAHGTPYVAPRGPVEDAVAAMWRDVLGVERVGVDDDFFELGGHSLRITQVLARVRDAFGVDLALRDIYEAPTVAATAQTVTLALLDDPELASLIDELDL